MEENIEVLYRKFSTTGQAALKLDIALDCFFREGLAQEQKSAYRDYLKLRLNTAMELLIEHEEVGKMRIFWEQGWIQPQNVDRFITMAREKGKIASLTYLLQGKKREFSFQDKDFSL